MAKTQLKIEYCICCGCQDIEVTGNKYYCRVCDVTYKVTEAGTKVVETDPLGKEKARIATLEDDVAELKGQKPAEPAEPAEPEPDLAEPKPKAKVKDDDDEDDEQDAFVSWK